MYARSLGTLARARRAGLTVKSGLIVGMGETDDELRGLVYSLTEKQNSDNDPWILRPAVMGTIVMIAVIILNYIFW